MADPTLQQNKAAGNKLILVAEDDNFYANIYKMKLMKEGYEVLVVGNGSWVMKTLEKRKPKLIVLDLVMPVMDGFVTLEKIKENKEYKDIKILVLTNLGQEEDAKRAMSLGADDYLVKTNTSIQEVMKKIHKYL